MKIETRHDSSAKVNRYFIEGELDVHQVKALKARVFADFDTAPDWKYVLDLKSVSYLDSSGLGMLVYLKKEINRKGGGFEIINMNEQVLSVFKMTKLEDFFGLPANSKV